MRTITLLAFLVILVAGCAATEADLEKVDVGMTKEHVKKVMGPANIVKDTAWIYNNVGEINSVHIFFKDENDEATDRVTEIVKYARDPQMRGEPR